MKISSEKKAFIKGVGSRLLSAFEKSEFKSYKQLARRAAELGYKFSPELLARYFNGSIEPGIFALTGIIAALGISADDVLFGGEMLARDPERNEFVDEVSDRLREHSKSSEFKTPLQLALVAQNLGFNISRERVEQILEGKSEAGIYEFTAILSVMKVSSDAVLMGTDRQAEAGTVLRETADRLVDLLEKAGAGDQRMRELTGLFAHASTGVQDAVLELLRSASSRQQ